MAMFEKVEKNLLKASNLGLVKLDTGVTLIGHVPFIAPHAYLHQIFPPLIISEIEGLQRDIGTPIPEIFVKFLLFSNGLKTFSDSFCINGLRKINVRAGKLARQPYDITTANCEQRHSKAPKDWLFIGGYGWDGSLLAIDLNGKAFRCDRSKLNILNTWPSFDGMLISEVMRISQLYDSNGRVIDENEPTTP